MHLRLNCYSNKISQTREFGTDLTKVNSEEGFIRLFYVNEQKRDVTRGNMVRLTSTPKLYCSVQSNVGHVALPMRAGGGQGMGWRCLTPTAWQGLLCRATVQPEDLDSGSDLQTEFANIAHLALEI